MYSGCNGGGPPGLSGFWADLYGGIKEAVEPYAPYVREGWEVVREGIDRESSRELIESLPPEQRAELEREYARQRAAELAATAKPWLPFFAAGITAFLLLRER